MPVQEPCRNEPPRPPPRPPPCVDEFRAALVSVALRTDPRSNPLCALTPAMRPLPLPSAIQLVKELPRTHRPKAIFHTLFRLSTACYVEGNTELKPHIRALVGDNMLTLLDRLLTVKAEQGSARLLTLSKVRTLTASLAREVATGTTRSDQDMKALDERLSAEFFTRALELPELELPPQAEFALARGPLLGGPESRLDLTTLTTTVDIPSTSNRSFAELADILNPLNWSVSEFWPECFEVVLDPSTHTFTRAPPRVTPAERNDWEGFLFEHVRWNWNLSAVASFRNFLKVKYKADNTGNPSTSTIRLDFSLYACEGSELFSLVSDRGVDIDFGSQTVRRSPSGTGWILQTQKNLRFADTLNRRTPFEGPVGSGQLLTYMAPAIVGLWMNDLLTSLDVI